MKRYSHTITKTDIQHRPDRAHPVFAVQYGYVFKEKRFAWDWFRLFDRKTVEWQKKVVYFDVDGNVIE